jgi:hypothetical protein
MTESAFAPAGVEWSAMCEKCQQLEIAVQRYRKLLAQGHDPRILAIQRCRKLRARDLDPLTIGRINATIQQLVRSTPADALTADRSALRISSAWSLR